MLTGTLIRKMPRQLKYSVITPPRGGPSIGPSMAGMVR